MQRLAIENKNTSEEYNRIFIERQKKGVDWNDMRRWKQLIKYFKGGLLLDIGCLDSKIPQFLEKEIKTWWDYLGIDIASQIKSQDTNDRIHYRNEDFFKAGFVLESFDHIVMGEFLEHIENPIEAIRKAFQLLKPNGVLAISVPYKEETELGAIDKEHHLWSFDKKDIHNFLQPYCNKIRMTILVSQLFPYYRYCFPTLIVWGWKK